MNDLWTIGYEGKTLFGFVRLLWDANVDMVIDVRERARAPRKGFSKSAVIGALRMAGIKYVAAGFAGNPLHGSHVEYKRHLESHPDVLDELEKLVADHRPALMCAEKSHDACHRAVLANQLEQRLQRKIHHL
ncbi:hypothetical protein BH09MYX1_BH09MYX1_00310 [soil metagenome]